MNNGHLTRNTDLGDNRPSFTEVMQNRSFVFLWLAQLVSQLGDSLLQVALVWFILQSTDSAVAVGGVIAVTLLPTVILAPLLGVFVDRFNRRTVLIVSIAFQSIIVLMMGVMFTLNRLEYWDILLLLFALYSIAQLVRPSVNALVPNMIDMSDLPAANSLMSITLSMTSIAGFSLGGVVILFLGVSFSIYYDFLSFVIAALMLAFVRSSYGEIPKISAVPDKLSYKERFSEGLRFISGSNLLKQLAAVAVVINYFGAGINALVAPYVKQNLYGNSSIYGFLLASYSLGSIVGFIIVSKLDFRNYTGKILFTGVIAFGVLAILLGTVMKVLIAVVLFSIIGFALASVNLPVSVLLQVKVPNTLRGRVGAVLGAVGAASQPLSALISGSIGESVGVGKTFQLYGFVLVVASLIMLYVFRELLGSKY